MAVQHLMVKAERFERRDDERAYWLYSVYDLPENRWSPWLPRNKMIQHLEWMACLDARTADRLCKRARKRSKPDRERT